MIKLLYALGVWGNGGIEKVITTYCKSLPKDKYKIDIFTLEKNPSVFDIELESLGIYIHYPTKNIRGNFFVKNKMRKQEFLKVALQGDYDIIHYHNSFAIVYLYLSELKKKNLRCKIILHSHGDNAEAPYVIFKRIFNRVVKQICMNVPDFCIACSERAGRWLFSNKVYCSTNYKTITNAFDTKSYCFDSEKRKKIHKELGIESVPVFGTIGRFCYQKNPEYILDILCKLDKLGIEFVFIWIGEGEGKESIVRKVVENGLDKKIRFIASTNEVQGYLASMDAFILPSRYEGLVLVLIEALCSGLPCYVSDKITREVQLTDKIQYLPISSVDIWVQKLIDDMNDGKIIYGENKKIEQFREYPNIEISNSKFNLKTMIENLQQIYEKIIEGQ